MRWPWSRPNHQIPPNPRPDLFSEREWRREVERFDRIMVPVLRRYDAARRDCNAELDIESLPLPLPEWMQQRLDIIDEYVRKHGPVHSDQATDEVEI